MTPPDAEPPQPPVAYEPFTPDALEWIDSGGAEPIETKDLQLIQEVEK